MTLEAGLRRCSRIAVIVLLLCTSVPACGAAPSPTAPGSAIAVRDGQPRLLVDGKPFFFFGGAFFYPRIAPERWRASMESMRALGANTIDLYVPWNWHEPQDGTFDFDGSTDPRRNVREVLRLGTELGFHFIIRPGPVIRNEWRNGGYPAWLLTRPEYDMPLHDVLEGRYPATATLQNAHSDDAAAEWMHNATHMTYSARWLQRVLTECLPYRDRILAVQLDDDQGAYIDNQTYPAPNFQHYIGWLNDQVHAVMGPQMPTFINTYQMRVPSSSPVWTMGNWYQSDAVTVSLHDRVDLDFSTLLLALNHRGPLAQSEFQAGWLAGPEDPLPRPADPSNTAVALGELLALGVTGVVDFPLQDTFAEPGWEAPFSNAFYGWGAALGFAPFPPGPREDLMMNSGTNRLSPTRDFGWIAHDIGPILAGAHRLPDVAIAYAEPPPTADSTPPHGAADIVAAVRAAIVTCIAHGLTCDLIDQSVTDASLRSYTLIILPMALRTAAPDADGRIRAAAARAGVRVAASSGDLRGSGFTSLRGPLGTIRIASNWSGRLEQNRFAKTTLLPHSVVVRVANVALSALGDANEKRRVSSDDCDLRIVTIHSHADPFGRLPPTLVLTPHGADCTVRVTGGQRASTIHLGPKAGLSIPTLRIISTDTGWTLFANASLGGQTDQTTNITPGATVDLPRETRVAAGTVQTTTDLKASDFGDSLIELRNDRLRLLIDPAAGARAFSLQARDTVQHANDDRRRDVDGTDWSANAFDATGAMRDDLAHPLPASARDYIAQYTHSYPAGTFNRSFVASVLSNGTHAAVRFTYAMPDAEPAGTIFERIVTLDADATRIVVDERITAPDVSNAQHLVARSSLPLLLAAGGLHRVRLPDSHDSIGSYTDGFAFVVAWTDRDVESAAWTPYRSTGTLALTMTPGVWHRVIYSYAAVPSLDAARAFAEAERRWVSANPPPSP